MAGNYSSTKQFPENFLLGTATGAYQVEGAWDEDKSVSVWDEFFHSNEAIKSFRYFLDIPMSKIEEYKKNGVQPKLVDVYKGMGIYEVPSTAVVDGTHFEFDGDIAADTYHKTDTDVELLKELGVQVYRFTINPTRIIPDIHDHLPGEKGIEYYNHLIDKLVENGITPMVTMYHCDLSVAFHVLGGLTNHLCGLFYINYARICFERFGDRVKYWTGPTDVLFLAEGYGTEHFAPGYNEKYFSGFADYRVVNNSLNILANVHKMYTEEFKEKQKGEFGFIIDGTWYYPKDPNNPEHQKSAEIARISTFGMLMHVKATGQYPAEYLESIDKNSKKEGIRIKRVEQFSEEEQKVQKGSFDFIILNYFNSVKVRPMTEEELTNEKNLKKRDRGYAVEVDDITTAETREGFLNCLKYTDKVLNKPKILIGENGFPEDEGVDDSEKKINYHVGILNTLLEALDKNINVFGYCVWSFLDTLEFTFGYSKKFGIYAVDFNDESRQRTKKNSFQFFQQFFKTKKLPIEI